MVTTLHICLQGKPRRGDIMVTLNHHHSQESHRDDTKNPKQSSSSIVPMALKEVLYSLFTKIPCLRH
jgi:hypothetical protein